MPKRAVKALSWVLAGVLIAGLGLLGGWMVYNRKETGEWRVPTGDDLVRVKERLLPATARPPRTIYLHRGPITLTGGQDDASKNRSSVLRSAGRDRVQLRGFRGNERAWRSIVACVKETFGPFDIRFVEERPEGDDYFMVVVGGRPKDVGYKGRHVGGLAPFNGKLIPRAVVFVFSDQLRNRKRAVCNTLAMEVAHAYGLDHAYDCSDVMTYLPDCGPKYFRDKDVPCGEHEPRACPEGRPTQNSYRFLADAVGLKPGAGDPPR